MLIESTSGWGHFQVRFAEWQNGLMLFLWGLYMLLLPNTMSDPKAAFHWAGMVAMASQPVWGVFALLTGGVRLAALYVNGHHRRTPAIRLIASFFSSFVICQICIGLYASGTPSVGLIAVYPLFLLGDLYSAYRASADVTFVSRKHKAELSRGGSS